MTTHEDGRVDCRKVAQMGITAALLDYANGRRSPDAPSLQHESTLRLVAAQGDPVAVRLFQYAYLRAFQNPDPWVYYRL